MSATVMASGMRAPRLLWEQRAPGALRMTADRRGRRMRPQMVHWTRQGRRVEPG
ncbi:hypothetical protein AB0K02_23580 [Streptomyces sp. NPDC049597]|uniref:hypothetical protein n=1 Tax=Streptomyces sp. NPDC049597 TaxID=3155276 RepID=UPI0034228688